MSQDNISSKMNRRTFLQSSAALGAGFAFAPHILANAGTGGDDINVALLGCGAQGQVLMTAMLKIPGVRFKAVCDIWEKWNRRRVERTLKAYKHDVRAYTDYKEMLANEKDLDAVIIATPDFWHAPHTVDCLKAGLHVYCEKEMSNTLDGAKSMVQAAKESGKLLQIGHQRRSNPRYIHCYDKIITEAELLGRITTINGQWNRAVVEREGWPKGTAISDEILGKFGFSDMDQFRNWRWYKNLGGGPIVDLGAHQIDIYSWFLGSNPVAVTANGGTDYYDKSKYEWYDTVMAIYEYQTAKGRVRAFYQTLTTNSSQGYFETFMGDQGTLNISESASRGAVYREPGAPEWEKWVKAGIINAPEKEEKPEEEAVVMDARETIAPPAYELPIEFTDLYHKPHLQNFFDAIRGKAKLNCPAEVAYETAVAVLKVNEAVEKGCRLEFKEDEFKV